MTTTPRRITIKDVAALCGVSTQTVSRVLNNRPDVAPATRQAVETAIAELDYHPSALARSLVSQRSMTIGVLLAGMRYVGTAQTLTGIIDQSARYGLTVLISELIGMENTDPGSAIGSLLERHVDGIIMSVPDVGYSVERIQVSLARSAEPVVFVKAEATDTYSSVSIDNWGGVESVVDHLVSIGRRRIGHIAGPQTWKEAVDRLGGWRTGLEHHGLTPDERAIEAGDWSPRSGARAMAALLDRVPDLDAVVVGNDRMALGAMYVAHERGLRIPEDIAVTGFDEIVEAEWFSPPLTSVSQPLERMGREAVHALLSQIGDGASPSSHTVLKTQLAIRRSTIGTLEPDRQETTPPGSGHMTQTNGR